MRVNAKTRLIGRIVCAIVVGMSKPLTASQIERRARARGLSIAAMCRAAKIAPSTFARWKGGETSPKLDIYQRLLNVTARNAAPQQGDS